MEQLSHIAKHLRETFLPSPEDKERKIIKNLPPVFLRLYGDIDYEEQLGEIPEKFKSKFVILTTNDTPAEKIAEMRANHWIVVQSETVDTKEAKTNSSLLLNEGIRFAQELQLSYIFFLSSGFQGNISLFYSMFYTLSQEYPDQDCYYFLLPETHPNEGYDKYKTLSQQIDNFDTFIEQAFPFETALIMKTSMPDLETDLSQKGNLGTTSEAIPLGGMEFFMTLLATYKAYKDKGKVFAPRMLGISFPLLTRADGVRLNNDFEAMTTHSYVECLALVSSIVTYLVTEPGEKIARRLPTIHAALAKLHLTISDMQMLFSHTQFDGGTPYAFHFEEKREKQ